MSRVRASSHARALRAARILFTLVLLMTSGSIGCWEQWNADWFPQMKWQPAVQAFERPMHEGRVDLFLPAEGSVPIDGGEAVVSNVIDSASDHLVNPRPMSLESLENGRTQYEYYCATCHGAEGMGNGPVSMTGQVRGDDGEVFSGPFGGILPLTITAARSDGHVYTTIRHGRRRMPGYTRIASQDRWDIVNYVRYMTGQKGMQ